MKKYLEEVGLILSRVRTVITMCVILDVSFAIRAKVHILLLLEICVEQGGEEWGITGAQELQVSMVRFPSHCRYLCPMLLDAKGADTD